MGGREGAGGTGIGGGFGDGGFGDGGSGEGGFGDGGLGEGGLGIGGGACPAQTPGPRRARTRTMPSTPTSTHSGDPSRTPAYRRLDDGDTAAWPPGAGASTPAPICTRLDGDTSA